MLQFSAHAHAHTPTQTVHAILPRTPLSWGSPPPGLPPSYSAPPGCPLASNPPLYPLTALRGLSQGAQSTQGVGS